MIWRDELIKALESNISKANRKLVDGWLRFMDVHCIHYLLQKDMETEEYIHLHNIVMKLRTH